MSFTILLCNLYSFGAAVDCSSKSSYIATDSVYSFSLMTLPYDQDFLDPFLSEDIINSHYKHHHQGYVDKLNSFLEENEDLQTLSLVELNELASSYDALQKYAGGTYNHNLYWWVLTNPECAKSSPEGDLASKIEENWGSVDEFLQSFNDEMSKVFGSGWVWGCVNMEGNIEIRSSKNQINPIMQIDSESCYPFLACDIWEHAYYLQYNWDRQEYFDAFFDSIDWNVVEFFYESYSSSLLSVPF